MKFNLAFVKAQSGQFHTYQLGFRTKISALLDKDVSIGWKILIFTKSQNSKQIIDALSSKEPERFCDFFDLSYFAFCAGVEFFRLALVT